MFAFVVSHLLNHALGLVSLETAENAMWYLYRVYTSWLGSTARYVPVLARLGVCVAGKEVMALAQTPAWVPETFPIHHHPPPEGLAVMRHLILALRLFFVGSVAAVLLARIARRQWQRRHGVSRIPY